METNFKAWLIAAKPEYPQALKAVCGEDRAWGSGFKPQRAAPSQEWSAENRFAAIPENIDEWPPAPKGKRSADPPLMVRYKALETEGIKASAHWAYWWSINQVCMLSS